MLIIAVTEGKIYIFTCWIATYYVGPHILHSVDLHLVGKGCSRVETYIELVFLTGIKASANKACFQLCPKSTKKIQYEELVTTQCNAIFQSHKVSVPNGCAPIVQ